MQSKRILDAFVSQTESGGSIPQLRVAETVPHAMPFTDLLGTDLLILDEVELDVLATLRSNLELAAEAISEAAEVDLGFLRASQLRNLTCFCMDVLAQAFEHFCPTRKFDLEDGQGPRLASAVLKELAAER